MYTYEDLTAIQSDRERALFCQKVVKEHMSTEAYRVALDADMYYKKHNATIENFKKWLYTLAGNRVEDIISANFKLETLFFRNDVIQKTSYILGKGVQITNGIGADGKVVSIKDKFGKDIDARLKDLGKMAHVHGKSYGFWNCDHLEVFGIIATDSSPGFAPLLSLENGKTMAGVRFWIKTVDSNTIYNLTLYEPDGITKYRYNTDKDYVEVVEAKHGYIHSRTTTAAEGVLKESWDNYGPSDDPWYPIIMLHASDTYESELVGLRERIDCDDIISSGLANNITDAAEIYWLISNAGGMNDRSLAQLLERLRTVKAAVTDSDEAGTGIKPETINVPYEARQAFHEMNRTYMYDNAMLMDRRSMSAAQKTQQELDMAYQPQDDYTDDFEDYLYDFMDELLKVAGYPNAEVTFIRNKVTNDVEKSNMVLSYQNYLPAELIISKAPFLTPEEMQMAIEMYNEKDMQRFNDDDEEEPEEQDQEEEDTEGEE